ncbi:MAG: PorT family protein [Bacteroidetes bacterium]|nr:PorT family protein [Bacteroidota bacterium]
MKKIFLLINLLAILSITAQEAEPRKETKDSRNRLHLGIKMGSNLSNVYDEQGDFSPSSKYGLVAGGFLNIPVGKYVGIHPEVLYSQKGFKASGKYLGTSYDLVRTTSYVDVPLMLALKPLRQLTFVAGPNYSYLIRQKDVFLNGTDSSIKSEDFQHDDVRTNVLGAVIGADINIWNIVLSARYGFDVLSNYKNGNSGTPRYKNVWLQGTIGFRIF